MGITEAAITVDKFFSLIGGGLNGVVDLLLASLSFLTILLVFFVIQFFIFFQIFLLIWGFFKVRNFLKTSDIIPTVKGELRRYQKELNV